MSREPCIGCGNLTSERDGICKPCFRGTRRAAAAALGDAHRDLAIRAAND